MKDSAVLKRSMFSDQLPKSVRNSGIMAGFEDMEEPPEPETMPSMARTPQNPEILMNNLRGDMRSMDARYQELVDMVGEKAAKDTPPEVLAMLQMQLGQQQQQGIGALPQGAAMMPPPMGGGAPGGAPAMPPPAGGMPPPQGAMPPGMESAPPLPQGGAEQAPPTPDGMPPLHAQVGAFVNAGNRAAQWMAPRAEAANAALGRMFMQPSMTQPYLENLRGAGGRFTAEQINRGGDLLYPTFTQGVATGVQKLAEQYPRVSSLLAPMGTAATAAMGPMLGGGPETKMTPEEEAKYKSSVSQIPTDSWSSLAEGRRAVRNTLAEPYVPMAQNESAKLLKNFPAPKPVVEEVAKTEEIIEPGATAADAKKDTATFIKNATGPKETAASRIERIKANQAEYAPLFKELLGDTQEDARTNAYLLLAEAGFKLATTKKPTFAMALAESASGLPRGFAAILAQAKDRDIKLNTAALQQSISDVQEQDKYAQQVRLAMLKGDYDLLKEQAKNGTVMLEDAGMGGRVTKTPKGGYVGFSLDPKDPSVQSALRSNYTLRDTDNPFVVNRGEAPTTVETNKEERIKLGNSLRQFDTNLATINNMKGLVQSAYSPGTWFSDKINNLLVPISNGTIAPNFDTANAVAQLRDGFGKITKGSAAAADTGRISNQQQEWERENAGTVADPAAFFKNPELAAKTLNSLEVNNRNMRQQILTQLGFEKNEFVMSTPNTGTQNDPFIIPTDPKQQSIMFNFLGSTVGKIQNPNASVYVKLPNGRVDSFNPSAIRQLGQGS